MSKSRHRVYSRRMSSTDALLSTREAAQLLGVTVRQVQRFAADGTLPPVYRLDGKTGALLFDALDVAALDASREMRRQRRAA